MVRELKNSKPTNQSDARARLDTMVERLAKAPASREAREWLKEHRADTERSLGEGWSIRRSRAFIDRFYAAGARRVIAVEIDEYGDGHQNTGKLVVELPGSSVARKRIFALAGRVSKSVGFDPDEDHGQRLLFMMLD